MVLSDGLMAETQRAEKNPGKISQNIRCAGLHFSEYFSEYVTSFFAFINSVSRRPSTCQRQRRVGRLCGR